MANTNITLESLNKKINELVAEKSKMSKRLEVLEKAQKNPMFESLMICKDSSPYSITLSVGPTLGGVWISGKNNDRASIFVNGGQPALQLVDPNNNINTVGATD